jgi:hypothetical protein
MVGHAKVSKCRVPYSINIWLALSVSSFFSACPLAVLWSAMLCWGSSGSPQTPTAQERRGWRSTPLHTPRLRGFNYGAPIHG